MQRPVEGGLSDGAQVRRKDTVRLVGAQIRNGTEDTKGESRRTETWRRSDWSNFHHEMEKGAGENFHSAVENLCLWEKKRTEKSMAEEINFDITGEMVLDINTSTEKKMPVVLIHRKSKIDGDLIPEHNSEERLRFPRQVGISFKECHMVNGWKEFESFTCKDGTLKGVCYRLTVVRQFFKFGRDEGRVPSFGLFFERELTQKFTRRLLMMSLRGQRPRLTNYGHCVSPLVGWKRTLVWAKKMLLAQVTSLLLDTCQS